jgi:gas vesicle protein
MSEKDNRIAAAALLMVAGGIIGAGVALLFAPQSGEKTRRDLYRGARKIKMQAEEAVDEISDNILDLVDTLEEKTEDLLDKSKDVSSSAKKDLIKLIEEGASKLEKFRTKLTRA